MYTSILEVETKIVLQRRSLIMCSHDGREDVHEDTLAHLTEDERKIVRVMIHHYRADRIRGKQWRQLWPSDGNGYSMPIFLPELICPSARIAEDEVDLSNPGRRASQPSTPIPEEVPQLEHVEEEDEEDESCLPPTDLNGTDTIILNVLRESTEPIKIITIASRGRIPHNSYLRERVRQLTIQGRIRKMPYNRYASFA